MSRAVPYSDYLRSPYWRAIRRQMLWLYPRCQRCGNPNRLPDDLEVLCETCHGEHHGIPVAERDWSGPEHISTILARITPGLSRRTA